MTTYSAKLQVYVGYYSNYWHSAIVVLEKVKLGSSGAIWGPKELLPLPLEGSTFL